MGCLLNGGHDVLTCTHGYNAGASQCGGLHCGSCLLDGVVFLREFDGSSTIKDMVNMEA